MMSNQQQEETSKNTSNANQNEESKSTSSEQPKKHTLSLKVIEPIELPDHTKEAHIKLLRRIPTPWTPIVPDLDSEVTGINLDESSDSPDSNKGKKQIKINDSTALPRASLSPEKRYKLLSRPPTPYCPRGLVEEMEGSNADVKIDKENGFESTKRKSPVFSMVRSGSLDRQKNVVTYGTTQEMKDGDDNTNESDTNKQLIHEKIERRIPTPYPGAGSFIDEKDLGEEIDLSETGKSTDTKSEIGSEKEDPNDEEYSVEMITYQRTTTTIYEGDTAEPTSTTSVEKENFYTYTKDPNTK